eukprot:g33412.t1
MVEFKPLRSEYFVSEFTVEKDIEDIERGEIDSDILKNVHITEEEVLGGLKRIKVDKFPGPDQAHPKTLWEVREVIAGPLPEIFVSSIAP